MTLALASLLGFVGWTVVLALAIVVWRMLDAVRGARRLTEFTAGVPHGSDMYWRLNRAHLNCIENLPMFGATVLTAHATGTAVGPLAAAVLVARLCQSLFHLASGRSRVILLRGACYVAQLVLILAMVITIVRG
jgi:uncharacterized MAPEG superfamily protein